MLTQARRTSVAQRDSVASLLLVCLSVLAGCEPRRPQQPAGPAPTIGQQAIPAGARRYTIDASGSVVTLRVYRAGPLARLGHNHVITSTQELGYAWVAEALTDTGFEVRVPTSGLVVDDPAARAAAGTDFPGELPADAREGTRRNLLRREVLDADRHPEIVVRSNSLSGDWQQAVAAVRITLKDQTRSLDVPLVIDREPGRLSARGSFSVRQSDFGITPFSVAGGAIQVSDAVDVSFEIRAVAR